MLDKVIRTIRPTAVLILGLLSVACGGGDGGDGQTDAGPAPGVVLVVVDTLRADHLGAYGYDRDTSPNLDRLAAEGAVFEAAIAQASFSGPSYATILTGKLPQEHGVRNHPQELADDHETLAEAASAAGAATAGFVAHPFLAPKWNYGQGFATYELLNAPEGAAVPGGRVADVVDAALAWLAQLPAGEPFVLFVQVMEPHMPYAPPAPFDTRFGPAREGFTLMDDVTALHGGHAKIMFGFEESGYGTGDLERAVELYDGTIAQVDHELQRLWTALAEAGRLDSTLVAVTADHGEMLGEHGLHFHHDMSLYDPVVRVPLVLRLPGTVPAGRRVSNQVRLMDLGPTLLDLAGLGQHGGATGRSLRPLLSGAGRDLVAFAENQPLQEDRVGLESYEMEVPGVEGKWRMVRTGDAKLILQPREGGFHELLFDLAADPGETTNVIADEPELADRMRRLMGQHLKEDPALQGEGGEEAGEVDDETLEQLKALGYVG